jgi:hypothetical protein
MMTVKEFLKKVESIFGDVTEIRFMDNYGNIQFWEKRDDKFHLIKTQQRHSETTH